VKGKRPVRRPQTCCKDYIEDRGWNHLRASTKRNDGAGGRPWCVATQSWVAALTDMSGCWKKMTFYSNFKLIDHLKQNATADRLVQCFSQQIVMSMYFHPNFEKIFCSDVCCHFQEKCKNGSWIDKTGPILPYLIIVLKETVPILKTAYSSLLTFLNNLNFW